MRSRRAGRAPAAPASLRLMRRCLVLAARADGRTSPNPMVGAVVVKAGRVIAEAWHRKAGGSHAEAAALRKAGRAARGAILYVNLEPCSHYGRTPPCTDAIVAAGVRRVVAAHRDPNPLVDGRGFAALRRAGVAVEAGPLRAEAMRLNERYLAYVTRRRPFVLVKAAITLDGRIATATGRSRWISSPASRALAHRLRARYDAVMIGANTARIDDPLLTARSAGGRARGRQPVRAVLDGRLGLSPRARLLRGKGGQVLLYTTRGAPRERSRRLEARGARVVRVASAAGRSARRVDLRAVLEDLARRGVTSVMIEGGGEVIASAFEAGLVDKVAFLVAPLIVGGRQAVPAVGGRGAATPARGVRLGDVAITRVGPDLLVEAYVQGRRG